MFQLEDMERFIMVRFFFEFLENCIFKKSSSAFRNTEPVSNAQIWFTWLRCESFLQNAYFFIWNILKA